MQCSAWLAFKSYDKMHAFHKVARAPRCHKNTPADVIFRLQKFDGHKFLDDKGSAPTLPPCPRPLTRVLQGFSTRASYSSHRSSAYPASRRAQRVTCDA